MPSEITRSFEEVVLCHLDLVYRMSMKLAGDPHEAEDLVQETFLRAHRAYSNFELREYGAKPWLLRILHNVFFTRCGRAGRAPSLLEDLSLDDIAAELEHKPLAPLAADDVDWEQFDEELKAAVLALAPEYRSVIVLWALSELSYKEIARVLGCALGTVMSRLYRARQQLGDSLSEFAKERRIQAKPEVKRR
ncbi:MAG: RNA polymerase sigma factor [Phycisphaerae bacterium]